MKILLIAGHGQGDPGACANGYQEAVLTRELVGTLSNILRQYAEVDVFDTSKNMYKYLKSNKFDFRKYDYVLEVHFNAWDTKAKGVEILIHTSEDVCTVEELILKNISRIGFTKREVVSRGDLQNMNICKGSQDVSYALIETCFIDNVSDMKLYEANKDKVAQAIADGIIEGFCLKTKDRFKDISNCYGREHINDLAKMGVVNGKGDGTFAPKENITREDVAIMVRNAIRYITGK